MRKGILALGLVAVGLVGPMAGSASAQADVTEIATAVDEVWLVLAAALVMLMQAGFTLVASSDALRNPDDDRTKMVFDKSMRGSTDRFILAFTR